LGAAESRGAQSPDCKLIPMKAAAASNAVANTFASRDGGMQAVRQLLEA
jgi:hypothetical protein